MKKVKIPIEKAVGEAIPHDFTRIDPDTGFKGVYFRRGHIIKPEDIEKLKSIGKNYIYKLQPSPDDIHEDEFAIQVAPLIAGENISYSEHPSEGKISFYAQINGLFKVDKKRTVRLNLIEQTSFPTIHNNFPVKRSQLVAAFRIIPLFASRRILQKAKEILKRPLISVKPYIIKSANIIVTGTEVYEGRVKDKFIPKMRRKLSAYGVSVEKSTIVPDDVGMIREAFEKLSNTQLVVVTGGSSVDPDDVTKKALKRSGVRFIREGNPIQPANNLTIGYLGDVTICIVPAGALFYKTSAFDIFLPRLLAKDTITKKEIADYAVGGLCHFCKRCTYPICPFGKV